MPQKTWTLTDVAVDVFLEQLSIGAEDIGGAAEGYSVTKRTLRGGLRDGVDIVEVDNGQLWFAVVPTRGMDIWGAICGDMHLARISHQSGRIDNSVPGGADILVCPICHDS